MTLTLTWQGVLISLLIIAGIAALVYLCIVLANLVTTLKKVNLVLDDAKEITEFATTQTDKASKVLGGMEDSVSAVVSNLKANKNTIKNVSSLVGATTSIIGVAKATGKRKQAKAAKDTATKKKGSKNTAETK